MPAKPLSDEDVSVISPVAVAAAEQEEEQEAKPRKRFEPCTITLKTSARATTLELSARADLGIDRLTFTRVDEDSLWFVDPFDGGRLLPPRECVARSNGINAMMYVLMRCATGATTSFPSTMCLGSSGRVRWQRCTHARSGHACAGICR
jgi:hypothetical protein